MKKIITLSLATAFGLSAMAQEPKRVCGTLEHEQYLDQQNPTRAAQKAAYAKAMNKWIENHKNDPTAKSQTTVMIPLVVHMVYSSTADSVSDAQIFSQIQILNDDFTRQNADKVNTPSTFTAVASAPMVNYCWAQRDPNGNATNGIERHKSATTSWSTNDAVKHASSDGMDAWDPSRYFNIWVCPLQSPLLGYGEFPTGTLSQTYGFVANCTAFGNTGLAQAPFNGGRTATHEIGHCFNLFHIWGDDNGACTGTDQCADTPNQASENYNCPTYPHTDACSTTAPGVMFMNYMDYTDDGCMNIFTANQATRMLAVINNPPYNSLTTSNGCQSVTTVPLDAGISAITKPSGSLGCSPTFTPNVTLKNWGTTTLTSCKINYKVDAGTASLYNWSGSLAAGATATVNLPAVTASAGTHTFTAYTSAPNGGTDGQTTNDSYSSNFSVVGSTGMSMPLTEGFEGTTFPPSGWTLNNPDNATTWARTTVAAKTGVASAFMDNYNYNASGQVDELIAPSVNLTGGTSPVLTFQVAYQMYTDPSTSPNYSDTLNVMISTNCGSSYTSIYKKFSSTLATTNPTFSTTQFTPTSSQWRMETISLSTYSASTGAIVKFHHTTDFENQMYIDDVNISATMGINVYAALAGIQIYPNPSADGKFFVDVKQNESQVQKLSVYDVLGNKVYGIDQHIPTGFYEMNLDNLSNGTYLVEIIKDNKPVYTKVVINKQ